MEITYENLKQLFRPWWNYSIEDEIKHYKLNKCLFRRCLIEDKYSYLIYLYLQDSKQESQDTILSIWSTSSSILTNISKTVIKHQ